MKQIPNEAESICPRALTGMFSAFFFFREKGEINKNKCEK